MNTITEFDAHQVYEIPAVLTPQQCQRIINTFEAHPEEHDRNTSASGNEPAEERTTIATINGKVDHWQDIDELLFNTLGSARHLLGTVNPFFKNRAINDRGYEIMRTCQNERYNWHVDSTPDGDIGRVMACIWYLNTLEPGQGGRTQFRHQNLSIIPKAGNMVLFPPYHTHFHRGEVMNYGVKYIIVTWMIRIL